MTCKELEQRLLALDNDEALDSRTRAHIDNCSDCRRLAETLGIIDRELRLTSSADDELVETVMAEVKRSEVHPTRVSPLSGWFFGGLLLMVALIAVRQSEPFRYLMEGVFGARVDLSVTLVIGVGLVGYLAVLVIANGDRLEEIVQEFVSGGGSGRR